MPWRGGCWPCNRVIHQPREAAAAFV